MGGLFDKLKNQLDNREQEGGISPLDIASLPLSLRRIMRLMLRELEMTHPQIHQAIQEMPEADRLTDAELKEALDALTKQAWLIRMGQDELITYKVNLRRKAGSSLTGGIWTTLESKLEQSKPAPETGEQNPDNPTTKQ